jgi:hypothetical protein
MGELCRKFGEKILGEIVPILREQAASPDAQTREGVCFALSEVMFVIPSTKFELIELIHFVVKTQTTLNVKDSKMKSSPQYAYVWSTNRRLFGLQLRKPLMSFKNIWETKLSVKRFLLFWKP